MSEKKKRLVAYHEAGHALVRRRGGACVCVGVGGWCVWGGMARGGLRCGPLPASLPPPRSLPRQFSGPRLGTPHAPPVPPSPPSLPFNLKPLSTTLMLSTTHHPCFPPPTPHTGGRPHARVRPRHQDLHRAAWRRGRPHLLRTLGGAPGVGPVQQVRVLCPVGGWARGRGLAGRGGAAGWWRHRACTAGALRLVAGLQPRSRDVRRLPACAADLRRLPALHRLPTCAACLLALPTCAACPHCTACPPAPPAHRLYRLPTCTATRTAVPQVVPGEPDGGGAGRAGR